VPLRVAEKFSYHVILSGAKDLLFCDRRLAGFFVGRRGDLLRMTATGSFSATCEAGSAEFRYPETLRRVLPSKRTAEFEKHKLSATY